MSVTTENVKRWIEQSGIDYFTYFIKAWIPFNAWYNSYFSSLDGERAKINAIKRDINPVRTGISVYMEDTGQEGDEFRNYLSQLHYALQNNSLICNGEVISFHNIIKEKNHKVKIDNRAINSILYYLERTDSQRIGEIINIKIVLKSSNSSTFFSYTHTEYDLSHLQSYNTATANYSNLSPTQKENVRLLFEELNPIVITDSLESNLSESPKNYYKCDSYNFKRDASDAFCKGHIVSKGLIEVLYKLRNILFHGELIPSDTIQPVYRNAYFLLKMILEKVK